MPLVSMVILRRGGIVLMRRMMRESLAAVAAGRDPLCIIRDPGRQIVEFRQD